MQIPNKAYYPEFDDGYEYSQISFVPRENSREDNLITLKLPNWLSSMIEREVNDKQKEAVTKFKKELKQMFDV